MTGTLALDALVLHRGSHASRSEGVCLLEAAAWWADEPHSDEPECVSGVLAAFGRAWNDGMRSDDERAQLRPYVGLLPGTGGDPPSDACRRWMATDWLVRHCAPAWLRAAGLTEPARALASLGAVTDAKRGAVAVPRVRRASAVARDAAGMSGGDGGVLEWGGSRVDAAVGVAVRAAGSDAARTAAVDRGEPSTWEWDAIEWGAIADVTWAAWEVVDRAAGLVAGVAAAWAAAGTAAARTVPAVGAAAREALEPTVRELQPSAHGLFREMIAVRCEHRSTAAPGD